MLPPGTLRGVFPRLWSRGPAAAEAPRRVRSRGSHIDLADGLETGSPYFHLYSPGLALSQGGSLSCSSSPLSESALICSSFSPRRFICFVPSGSRVAEAARALWQFSVHLWTFRPCLLVWVFDCILTAIWLRSSPNCVPAPYSGNVTSRTRRIGVRVTLPGRRRICGSIVFGQNALMPMVQGLEGRPLWGRAVYTALHGARLSSVPSGDQSANPASVPGRSGLQRAFLSVSSAQKCSGAGRLATASGVSKAARSAVPCRSSAPGTELAALSTPEASLKRLVPLVGHPAAWEPLPSMSHWDLPEQTLVPSLP